jgi:hypothetical protein
MSDDVSSFAIHQALTANPSADGTHVILELTTAGENLPISIPIQELGPMVALLSQAARLGSRLIKSTIQGLQQDRQTRDSCGPTCHSVSQCA